MNGERPSPGETFNTSIVVRAHPEPIFEWSWSSKSLQASQVQFLTEATSCNSSAAAMHDPDNLKCYRATLVIASVTRAHSSKYQVLVSNYKGSSLSSHQSLDVQCTVCSECTANAGLSDNGEECECQLGFYRTPSTETKLGFACEPCHAGTDCTSKPTPTLDTLIARPGYYRSSTHDIGFYQCAAFDPSQSENCAGGQVKEQCALHSSGVMCSQCSPGFYLNQDSGQCETCADNAKASTIALLVVLCLVLICIGCCKHKRTHKDGADEKSNSQEHKGNLITRGQATRAGAMIQTLLESAGNIRSLGDNKLVVKSVSFLKQKAANIDKDVWSRNGAKGKILIGFMQVINQIKFVYDIPFPGNFLNLISGFGFANMDILTVVGMGCVTPVSFYDKFVAMTLTPIVLAAALGVKYKLSKSADAKNKSRHRLVPEAILFGFPWG